MKILLTLVILFILAPSFLAPIYAETRYVSDSLTIFIRTGPTHQFRIVGTLVSGEPIEVIQDDAENNATQVRLSTGREVWVDTDQLIINKPKSLLLVEVQSELQQLQSSTTQQISNLKQKLRQANDLAAISKSLQEQVTQLEYDKELLDQKNQTLSDRSRYDLMTAGGIVALAGLLLGLILPTFMSRRKRNSEWR